MCNDASLHYVPCLMGREVGGRWTYSLGIVYFLILLNISICSFFELLNMHSIPEIVFHISTKEIDKVHFSCKV